MIRLKSILSEIYIDGFSSSDEKSKFRRPENFDSYDKGAGWSSYRGGNDWENGTTACAVYFEGKEGELARTWIHIQFPDSLKEFVGSHSSSPEANQVKKWGEKASKTWTKLAKQIHHESKHQVNENDPNSSWLYKDWKECFVEALKSEEMKPFVKERGVDSTHWKGMKQSLNENVTPTEDEGWFELGKETVPNYVMPVPEEPYGKVNMHYWLSPSGHFYEADRYHWKWARQHVVGDAADAVERMVRNGWVRVNTDVEAGITREIYAQGRLNAKQKKALEDFAFENEMPVLDDTGRIAIESTKEFYDAQQQQINESEVETKSWKAWWIDPNAQLHEVYKQSKSHGHWNWAVNFLAAAGRQRTEYEDPLEELYKRGWARLTYNYYHDGMLSFEYGARYPSPKVLKAIKDLAIELRASKLVDGNKDKEMDLMEQLNEVMTYNKLMQLADKSPRGIDGLTRKQRAKTVRVRSIPVSMENGKESWNFRYASNPSNTAREDQEPLRGSIQFFKEIKNTSTKNAADLPCHVDCNCRDFMYRWAWNDAAKDASQIGPKSLNKCINRRPKPAYNLGEGLCKHLIALEGYLRTKIKAAKKSNLFEAMEEVARTNPQFNIEYND